MSARRRTNYGPARLAGLVGRHRSTVWKVLRRHGLSRLRRSPRQSYRRYEWSRPGALLHVDTAQLPRFARPGHRVTGDRARRTRAAGKVYLHACVDDHSRYAYVEEHPDERPKTAAAFMRRAIEHFSGLGLGPPEAVMTDNGNPYRSCAFGGELERVGARHILTPPYTPRWNGKVERFIGTLQQEWAYARTWRNSSERARSLLSFLRYYNRRRPHSSLGDRPPLSRVHNLCGQDS